MFSLRLLGSALVVLAVAHLYVAVRPMEVAVTGSGGHLHKPSTEPSQINAMQWSAHWKCFANFAETCQIAVEDLLPKFLTQYKLDFVNLGMFQDPEWQPPAEYGFADWKCDIDNGFDNIKFLYDKTKWTAMSLGLTGWTVVSGETTDLEKVSNPSADDIFGCGNTKKHWKTKETKPDRVYGVMAFQRKLTPEDKVIVVAGHFPHPEGGTSSDANSQAADTKDVLKKHMGAKIKKIQEKDGWKKAKVVLIGDLNNDIAEARKAEFDSAKNINGAFERMDTKTVDMVKGMKEQIRQVGTDADGKDIVLVETVENALIAATAKGFKGWVTQPVMSNEDVWKALEVGDLASATDVIGTCCADKPALVGDQVAFPYAFDRIMAGAGFGKMTTHMPLMELLSNTSDPDEVARLQKALFVGAFHMPIIGKIEY